MPPSEIHRKKKAKNLALLLALLVWCALIWAVSMVRMAQGAELDTAKAYIQGRAQHGEKLKATEDAWLEIYQRSEPDREKLEAIRDNNRAVQLQYNQKAEDVWHRKWTVLTPLRNVIGMAAESRKNIHQQQMESAPPQWWDRWLNEDDSNPGRYEHPHQ